MSWAWSARGMGATPGKLYPSNVNDEGRPLLTSYLVLMYLDVLQRIQDHDPWNSSRPVGMVMQCSLESSDLPKSLGAKKGRIPFGLHDWLIFGMYEDL